MKLRFVSSLIVLSILLLFVENLYSANGDLIVNGNLAVQGTLTAPNANILTKYYESPEQPITASGTITLAHGLGTTPKLVQCVLVCKIPELGYSVGDEVVYPVGGQSSSATDDYGLSVVLGATNINMLFGIHPTRTLRIIGASSHYVETATNANWKLIVRAWAF